MCIHWDNFRISAQAIKVVKKLRTVWSVPVPIAMFTTVDASTEIPELANYPSIYSIAQVQGDRVRFLIRSFVFQKRSAAHQEDIDSFLALYEEDDNGDRAAARASDGMGDSAILNTMDSAVLSTMDTAQIGTMNTVYPRPTGETYWNAPLTGF